MLAVTRPRRAWSLLLISVLGVAGLAIATPASAATASLTVNGTVYDFNGNPAVGATFHVDGDVSGAPTLVTDENGQFSATVTYTETYGWVAYQGPAVYEQVDLAALAGADTIDVVVNLPELDRVTVQGFISDAVGDPAPGVAIDALAFGSEEIFLESDEFGYFSFVTFAVPGDMILVIGDGFPDQELVGYADGDVIDLYLTIGGVGGDPVSITVHGALLDHTGSPVAGEMLMVQADDPAGGANEYIVTTDVNGQFVQVVDASTAGFISMNTLDWNYSDYVEVAALGGATDAYLTITLPEIVSVTVEGHVVDWQGSPVAGQEVFVGGLGVGGSGFTDETGFYSITVEAAIGSWIDVSAYPSQEFANFTVESDGQVFTKDFVMPQAATVTVQGTVTDALGNPVVGQSVDVSAGVGFASGTTDGAGFYSLSVAASIGAYVTVSFYPLPYASSWVAEYDGQVFTYDLQVAPTISVTVEGTITDSEGAPIDGAYVFASSSYASGFAATAPDGTYSMELLAVVGDAVSVYTDDWTQDWQYFTADYDGQVLTANWGAPGGPVAGTVYSCDVDGDGVLDDVTTYTDPDSGYVQFEFGVLAGPRTVDYGTAGVADAHCADLNGDGASEFIVQTSHEVVKPLTGEIVIKNDWWIYDFASDTATSRTFPNGEISGVVFENLDAVPGVEMIVERLRDSGRNTFWVIDDATAPVEKFRVGFGTGGTLDFVDFDGVEGIDIVTTKVKPNGTTVTEYYTRASGTGEILRTKVKAI